MSSQAEGGTPAHWIEEARSVEADCRVFRVDRRRMRHPGRAKGDDFFVVKAMDWSMAMAQTAEGEWVLVRQFRFGSGELSWEFPSGCVEAGEDPLETARRELEEESGYRAGEPVYLGAVQPNPAIMENTCHFYYFPNAEATGQVAWDPHEELEVKTVPVEEVVRWAVNGTIAHSLVHTALFLYQSWLERVRKQ